MEILFYIRKSKTKNTGKIYCQVTVGGVKGKAYSTGVECLQEEWNAKMQTIFSKDSNKQESIYQDNETLSNEIADLKIAYNALCADNRIPVVTANRVISEALKQEEDKKTFLNLVPLCFSYLHITKRHSQGTKDIHTRSLENLTEFLKSSKKEDIYCEEVTAQIWQQYQVWLITTKKTCGNGFIKQQLQHLRAVIVWAKQNGYSNANNVEGLPTPKIEEKKILYLTPEKVAEIYAHEYEHKTMRHVAHCFVFQFWTSLDFCDIKALNPSHFREENGKKYIRVVRGKSPYGVLLTQDLPFLPVAHEIWDKYEGKLPIHHLATHNRLLKEIAIIHNISINLTTKISRKSAGTYWCSEGISLLTTSQMMGHKDPNTTKKYYVDVTQKALERETEILFEGGKK